MGQSKSKFQNEEDQTIISSSKKNQLIATEYISLVTVEIPLEIDDTMI